MGREQNRRLWEAFVAAGSTVVLVGAVFKEELAYWLTFGSVQQATRPIVVIKLLRYFLLEIGLRNQSLLVILTGLGTVLSAAIKAKPQKEGKKKKNSSPEFIARVDSAFVLVVVVGRRTNGSNVPRSNPTFCSITLPLSYYYCLPLRFSQTLETLKFGWWLQIGLYTQEDCTLRP